MNINNSNTLQLDRYDLQILRELQRDAGLSNQDLAERIGLSASPCLRRVRQLEELGLIRQRVALLDRRKLGLTLSAYVLISMDKHTPDRFSHFEAELAKCPEVLECCLITGMEADYLIKVVATDMDHYQQFLLGTLTRIDGVSSVRSSFILRPVMEATELPLEHLRR
ncbi:Lrp/AsnC family transcriptional regulator [Atopomonas sediminilitoris]|uniref:Lrp/AsnC family transcriptional regulator n=1 Tax=Atopomonas sediminilitoris TaxID=2919919 RepID=UPI001F4DD4F8|nr:Lrp/AsnC family transcriptional regulator [Atopomonas sediminilitoris]MCJ8169814.1 Lrp/AsnC family transcriptional regulator [Atopomonas sediminilitoris]